MDQGDRYRVTGEGGWFMVSMLWCLEHQYRYILHIVHTVYNTFIYIYIYIFKHLYVLVIILYSDILWMDLGLIGTLSASPCHRQKTPQNLNYHILLAFWLNMNRIRVHHGKLYKYASDLRWFDLKQSYPKSEEYLTTSNHTDKQA